MYKTFKKNIFQGQFIPDCVNQIKLEFTLTKVIIFANVFVQQFCFHWNDQQDIENTSPDIEHLMFRKKFFILFANGINKTHQKGWINFTRVWHKCRFVSIYLTTYTILSAGEETQKKNHFLFRKRGYTRNIGNCATVLRISTYITYLATFARVYTIMETGSLITTHPA